jgi:hypothetical protein
LLTALAACGSEPPEPPGSSTSIFPVAVGNRWELRVDGTETKVQVVTGETSDGFTFETTRGDKKTFSIQRIDAEGRLVRASEYSTILGAVAERLTFVPADIRVDLDTIDAGATYSQTYLEDHDPSDGIPDVRKSQTFTVEAVDEAVTVPAGTYRTVRVRRITDGGPAKTFWYAKGIGKVKEVGGQLEELVASEIVSAAR